MSKSRDAPRFGVIGYLLLVNCLNGNFCQNKDNKIPNLKHQITNKSQNSIFNDQNIHPNWLASICNPWSAGDDAMGRPEDGLLVLNFEFGSSEFI